MTTMLRRIGVSVALLAALAGGWLWGASGRVELGRALHSAEVRVDLTEARASLLAARVMLYENDFRAMSRHLEDARGFAGRAGLRLESLGWKDEARRLDLALFEAQIDAAQRLGALLDRKARARAPAESTPTIVEALGAPGDALHVSRSPTPARTIAPGH